jgi:hypothetical protein
MLRLRALVVLAAAAILAANAYAEAVAPKDGARGDATKAAEPAKQSGSQSGEGGSTVAPAGVKDDLKEAWSNTRAGLYRFGLDIRDGARRFGRATRDAFQTGWRKVRGAFAGSSEREAPGRSG